MFRKIIRQLKFLSAIDNKYDGLKRLVQENYWANIYNNTIQGNKWITNIGISPGRWAVGYPVLYLVFRILNEVRPNFVLECGLGELTKMIQAYKNLHNNNAYCLTVEHDYEWIEFKKSQFLDTKLIEIIKCELEDINVIENNKSLVYKDLLEKLDKIDKEIQFNLIIIDGPKGSNRYSRFDIVKLIEAGKIHKDFIIILDDYERIGEKDTCEILLKRLEEMQINYQLGVYRGEKDSLIITSNSLSFYTTI
jgi:hypothetical protein